MDRRVTRGRVRAGVREVGRGDVVDALGQAGVVPVSYTHLRAHETVLDIVCRLLLEKKKHYTLDYTIRP